MPKQIKTRLDQLLVERGLAPSRTRAQALIMAGVVRVGGQRADKAGSQVASDVEVAVLNDPNPYVSRGGLKLAAAIEAFEFDATGCIAMDVGASTGGFTDCLLQAGAARVYAIDVGYGQLAWRLRSDPRVVVVERCNARHLSAEQVPETCDLAVMDVSFISLAKIVPAVVPLLSHDAAILTLVKPQFEAAPDEVGKGGVIKDDTLRRRIVDRAVARLQALNIEEVARIDSPVHGPKGNVECLVLFALGKHRAGGGV